VALEEVEPPLSSVRVSPTFGILTRTIFKIFIVRFSGAPPRLTARNRWITAAEILAGVTADRQPVSPEPMSELLTRRQLDLDALVS
jgi:hypothetical protein